MAGRVILARYGLASELVLGVARDSGAFSAHAWLRHNGRLILGVQGVDAFEPLPDLDARL